MSQATTLGEANSTWGAEKPEATEGTHYDLQLAHRIAGGDMQAFELLYQRYHRRIYALCLRMTNNVAEAEDLTQDVFIHVYRKIHSFRGESTMMTWLYRVTVNKVLMHFRKNSVRREQTTADGEAVEPVVIKQQQSAPVLERLALERAIEQLPAGYRAVFILHDVEGYEHSEVARICGNSIGTSKSQLHKARRKLSELLKDRNRA